MKYLKISELNGSSIENWASELDNQEKMTPLTEEDSEVLFKCMFNEEQIDNDPEFSKMLESNFMHALFMKRVKVYHTYSITPTAVVFISMINNFNPGISTMIANYLQYIAHRDKVEKFDLKYLTMKIFPNGFFSSDTLAKFWYKQKIETDSNHRSDNMLDYSEFGSSMR